MTLQEVKEFSEKEELRRAVDQLMSGNTIEVTTDSVEKILEALLEYLKAVSTRYGHITVTAKEIIGLATQFTKDAQFHYLNITHHALLDMMMLALVMTTSEDETRDIDICDRNGVFGYVYNFDGPDTCSELGYTYYEKVGDKIRRIG